MLDYLAILAADVTPFDWSTLNLTDITNAANTIAGVAIPVIVTVAALPVGVKLFKRFISKI